MMKFIQRIIFGKNCGCSVVKQVANKDRYKSANEHYYAVCLCMDGKCKKALFTKHEIERAIDRAAKNPEDAA
jgi:hypothetical protein